MDVDSDGVVVGTRDMDVEVVMDWVAVTVFVGGALSKILSVELRREGVEVGLKLAVELVETLRVVDVVPRVKLRLEVILQLSEALCDRDFVNLGVKLCVALVETLRLRDLKDCVTDFVQVGVIETVREDDVVAVSALLLLL